LMFMNTEFHAIPALIEVQGIKIYNTLIKDFSIEQ